MNLLNLFQSVKNFLLICIFFTILFTSLPVLAHKIKSLDIFINFYKNNDCHTLVKKLESLTQRTAWNSRDLWLRSRLLHAKCEIKLGDQINALKILNAIEEKEFSDAIIYQKIRALLKSKKHKQAAKNFEILLKHPKKKFYLESLREDIKREFVNDEDSILIFSLLQKTKNNKKWFLKDFKIHSLYVRGAYLNGFKLDHKTKNLGWQFPYDEKTARTSHQKMSEADLKKLTPKNITNRINNLYKLHLHKYLIDHIPQLIFSKDKTLIKSLGEVYLKSLFKQKFFTQITKLYENQILSKKWFIHEEKQLYWTARSYIKLKNIKSAKSTIYKLIRKNPKSKHLPFLFDNIASRYLLDSETEKAQFWWKKLLENFPKNRFFTKAIWSLAWTNIQENKNEDAILYLNKGLKAKIYNSETKAKFLYWLGKLYQKKGAPQIARKSFKEILLNQPNTYYGRRLISSENKLKSLFDTKISNQKDTIDETNEDLGKKIKSILRRSNFLFDILESEQAKDELFSELKGFKNKKLNWNACHLLKNRGEYNAVLKIIANSYLSRMVKLEIGNSSVWNLAFPRPYWGLLKNYSMQAGIDPYFALAIMREESHFNPKALSSSKAMGLMQLMPATAKDLAKRKKILINDMEEVYDPKLNIILGTFYLGKLAKKFQSELIFTAAGYNAGPHNMAKWSNRWNAISIDIFVEKIPFNETKNYVKRVYRSYKIYKKIYSPKIKKSNN